MNPSRVMKFITAGLEAILAIPILGGAIVLSLYWVPLAVMLILHIVTLVLSKSEGETESGAGSILGIITSFVAVIPVVGMMMHGVTFIVLLIDAVKSRSVKKVHVVNYDSNKN